METFCRATLSYASAGDGRASAIDVDIRNGRTADLPSWATCGFELVQHQSAMRDWTDDEEIAGVHYGEIESQACRLTGCDFALVSDHVKRSAATAKRAREQQPVHLVHSDFAADYADVIRGSYRDLHEDGRGAATLRRNGVSAEDVENASRIMMLQFWRNLGPARMDFPVAFCDARTVGIGETRPFPYTGYVAGGRSFNALAVLAPKTTKQHEWYTFPEMTPNEVVAFRTYDTELVRSKETFFMPHTAFRDPDVEPGNPPRFSIEMRVMCAFR